MPVTPPDAPGSSRAISAGTPSAALGLTLVFLAILATPGVIQATAEVRRGEWPQALDLFRLPTAANLRQYEGRLEDESWVARKSRPWVQWAYYALLREAGDQGLVGPAGWWFYRPGVSYLTQRQPAGPTLDGVAEATRAILHFRDQLAERGIRLLVLPAPNKESIYPEQLVRGLDGKVSQPLGRLTRELMAGLRSNGIEVVDLFKVFGAGKPEVTNAAPFYLRQDSHWSPAGIQHAARAVAERLRQYQASTQALTNFVERAAHIDRHGDVVRMLRSPPIEKAVMPETVSCIQVLDRQNGAPFRDDPSADVLVLGDSFLRVFEQDEPGSAGFVAHLAKELNRPVAALVADGGASTLVRQELYRRPALLDRKRVVIWEFVERDIRLGTEGWAIVPLPPLVSSNSTSLARTRQP